MMPIKNLSGIRRLPRLGKIHLGIKKTTKKDGTTCAPYPTEVDYFVVPEKVVTIYGEKPKELKIMFPVENADVFFAQFYKRYGASLLKCKGDGEAAWTWDEEKGGLKEIPCPCEKLEAGECKQVGILQFLLPEVEGAGIWQITTSSRNSIIDINSGIDFVRALCGRIRMIPLILRRVPTVMQRVEDGKPKKSTHFTLQIDLDKVSIAQLQLAGAVAPERVMLPPPDESKDDLLYPANGFEKEAEPEAAAVPDQVNPVADLGIELDDVIAQYEKTGNRIRDKERARIAELKTPEEFKKAIAFYRAGIEG